MFDPKNNFRSFFRGWAALTVILGGLSILGIWKLVELVGSLFK